MPSPDSAARSACCSRHGPGGRPWWRRKAAAIPDPRDRETSVVVPECAVHGRTVGTGRAYGNRFVSVVTIKDRGISHRRDCLDPVAVCEAVGRPIHHEAPGN
ncbi:MULTISPECIES: nuclear transport factor 2 family protein [unclassified Streptomyces]|uniref:nuclear transport factor 2 family protein n=1 Tax=unclassified Streptomyces TaxID=2593676 RepID=UPI002E0D7DAB|nr:hypothetical protein OG299_32155 [Streptomyces sp. NBC_01296]